jgi:uncharacterized protein YbbC (DUF1343 family)
VLEQTGFRELRGKRIGLITNPTGVNRRGESTIDVLRRAPEARLVALFGPEHGLDGTAKAGDHVADQTDPRTGLPVHSLYGKTRKPTPAMLKGLDALVYDLQDVGCRSYTFISTMGLAMEAAAEAGIQFIVLDRPNPVGGIRVEGPLLDPRFRSFVGQYDIPYVYGMTCGELARMIHGERWMARQGNLTIVPMAHWKRSMTWRDTGLRWVPTSPNIPHAETAFHYASTGVLGEIGNVGIGGRLGMPFACITAPWLNAQQLADQFNSYRLHGVQFVPFSTNTATLPQNGVRIVYTDPARAPLMAVNFYALDAIKAVSGRDIFAERVKARKDFSMFDKVMGGDGARTSLAAGQSGASLVQSWKPQEEAFRQRRQKYLMYE